MKLLISLFIAFFVFLNVLQPVFAQEQQFKNEFERGRVLKIVKEGKRKIVDSEQPFQNVEVEILTGSEKGEKIEVEHGAQFTIREHDLVKVGDEVVLSVLGSNDNKEYFIQDKYRLPTVFIAIIAFFVLVIVLSRSKGAFSILGLIFSIFVLLQFIVPTIIKGGDPVIVSLVGGSAIVLVSIFLAHGFRKRTLIAALGTFITLVVTVIISYFVIEITRLTGVGSEDAYNLQFGQFANINLKGLLFAGIIIGMLGVLDDVTTAQSAAVEELKDANKSFDAKELYKRGLSIGKEHISSLVNTLVLAYAGASLPVFLYFVASQGVQPLWMTLNSQFIIEEIVRAVVGSTALVLAVPITTFLAAVYFSKQHTK